MATWIMVLWLYFSANNFSARLLSWKPAMKGHPGKIVLGDLLLVCYGQYDQFLQVGEEVHEGAVALGDLEEVDDHPVLDDKLRSWVLVG